MKARDLPRRCLPAACSEDAAGLGALQGPLAAARSLTMSAAARKTLRTLLFSGLISLAAIGCARQSEGERCDLQANGSNDCEEGLRCVQRSRLANDSVDRCCPVEDAPISDSRCTPRSGSATGGGSGASSGGAGNGGSSGGTDAGGNGGTAVGGNAAGADSGGNAGEAPGESGAGGE